MSHELTHSFTCFDGHRRVDTGSLQSIALVLKKLMAAGTVNPVLVFDNGTGRTIDLDIRGSDKEVLARLPVIATANDSGPTGADGAESAESPSEARGRGRPKLGVVPREVTLLPRHWEWLGEQPGGASVMLRKLVEEARRAGSEKDRQRKAGERAYHFMQAIAGDLPGFEEATRALFAREPDKFAALIGGWPADIRAHAMLLGFGNDPDTGSDAAGH